MCGIVGFTGTQQAAPILLSGLSKLEYRGYDSAGIAVRDGDKLAEVVKAKGRLGNLAEKTDEGRALRGTCGIGHTRWATHGEPSQINAHPHVSGNCTRSGSGEVESEVVGVHNGIIENYAELKDKLLKHGYTFYSETDTEVVIKLVDYYYRKYNLGPVDAIAKTMVRVRGSYALELMFRDYPGEIWVARKDSPMIIGIADGETYVASDVPAILKYTRQVYYIGNLEFARLTPGEAHFYNLNGEEIEKQTTQIKWDAEAAEKAGFEHFMMKEIHEQPKAVRDTLNSVVKDGRIDFKEMQISDEDLNKYEQIYIVACGSAWHVGMAAQYVLEDLRYSGTCRACIRVPLSEDATEPEGTGHCGQSVWRDRRYPGCIEACKGEEACYPGDCQCSWKQYCPGGRSCAVYTGRTGDLCSDHKSLQCTAGSDVLSGSAVCQGEGEDHRGAVQLLHF